MDVNWQRVGSYEDIIFEKSDDGIARVTINRPQVRNAFRPLTVTEMIDAFADAREDLEIGVVILTGAGDEAFCSGGDQKVRGEAGYIGEDKVPRLNVLDLQHLIRYIPKPVIAAVAGYAIGGGHVLHLVCDLTIAADNARFGQTGPRVGSFDAGYGAGPGADRGSKEGQRDLVSLPPVRCAGSAGHGSRQHGRPGRSPSRRSGAMGAGDPVPQSDRHPIPEGRIQRRHGRTGGDPAACWGCDRLFYMTDEGSEGKNAFSKSGSPISRSIRGCRSSQSSWVDDCLHGTQSPIGSTWRRDPTWTNSRSFAGRRWTFAELRGSVAVTAAVLSDARAEGTGRIGILSANRRGCSRFTPQRAWRCRSSRSTGARPRVSSRGSCGMPASPY